MKKLLLSLAVLAIGLISASAKEYTLFSADNYQSWAFEGGADGYTATLTVDGEEFTITTAKSKSTSNLVKPGDQIRVYKNADITISSKNFKFTNVVLTASATNYGGEQTAEGWTQSWNADALTLNLSSETAANSVKMSATANQFRVVKIVVSDTKIAPEPEPEKTKVASVKEAIALANNTVAIVDFNLTVGFVNRSNIFAVDAAGDFIQVYGSNDYKVGDVIPAGWEAKYTLYNGATPEFMPTGTLPAATEGKFEAKEVAAADITTALVNSVVVVKNVVFDAATPAEKVNFTGKVGDTELSFRNNYTVPSVEAGKYDVTIVVTIFNNAPSLYIVSYAPAGSSAIDNIAADANAPVEYYNLQGIRVANPENGLFIRRQGSTVSKVIIR